MRRQRGYTYLLVLFLIAGLGLFAAQTGVVWQQVAQREREAELLGIGAEIADALGRYRDVTPVGMLAWPTDLQQLVEDRRFPVPRRHLRRIYRDPMTGRAEWGLLRQDTFIIGVHSLSDGVPIRRTDLPPALADEAEDAATYADWVFRPTVPEQAAPAR